MSVRFLRCLLFAAIMLSTAATSQADWLCEFLKTIPRDVKRRNCWPKPFLCPERQFERTPFALQVANGWRRQNMLTSYDFEGTDGRLNEAGKRKVYWILFEEPAQHRSIFVHIGRTDEETNARLNGVHEYAAQIMPRGDLPMITTTTIPEDGSPADRVDIIGRKYQAAIPAPTLPAPTNQNSSGGGAQ
jgi:hypothetical protein